jgi:hypothetical protein
LNKRKTLASNDASARKFIALPFQIVSLLDMVEFPAKAFYLFLDWLESFSSDARAYLGDDKSGEHHRLTDEQNRDLRTRIRDTITRFGLYCHSLS